MILFSMSYFVLFFFCCCWYFMVVVILTRALTQFSFGRFGKRCLFICHYIGGFFFHLGRTNYYRYETKTIQSFDLVGLFISEIKHLFRQRTKNEDGDQCFDEMKIYSHRTQLHPFSYISAMPNQKKKQKLDPKCRHLHM